MTRRNVKNVRPRPHLPKTDPEMQRWCERLERELFEWPDVTSRSMFGLEAFYRSGKIFAALPRTRAVDTPFSLMLKLPGVHHERLNRGDGPGGAWATFAMEDESDVGEALRWLERAYRKAVASGRRPGPSRAKTPRR